MNMQLKNGLLLAVVLICVASDLVAVDDKSKISIVVNPSSNSDSDKLSATTFGLSLAHWYEDSGQVEKIPNGRVVPSFEALKHAFENQVKIWSEMAAKETLESRYMDDLVNVASKGFISEYIWKYHRKEWWDTETTPPRLMSFDKWAKENIPRHKSRIEARLEVSGR